MCTKLVSQCDSNPRPPQNELHNKCHITTIPSWQFLSSPLYHKQTYPHFQWCIRKRSLVRPRTTQKNQQGWFFVCPLRTRRHPSPSHVHFPSHSHPASCTSTSPHMITTTHHHTTSLHATVTPQHNAPPSPCKSPPQH